MAECASIEFIEEIVRLNQVQADVFVQGDLAVILIRKPKWYDVFHFFRFRELKSDLSYMLPAWMRIVYEKD